MNYRIKDIEKDVKDGDDRFLRKLYLQSKPVFIKWVIWHFKCDDDDAKDAYQKSFSCFYFNILNNKVKNKDIKVETYLLGIGKNMIRKVTKKASLSVALDDVIDEVKDDFDYFENQNQNHRQQQINTILEKLGEPCKSVLYQYYFLNYSHESIASRQGYKNEAVAKKKKFICLQKIREMLHLA